MSDFNALVSELETIAKAMPAADDMPMKGKKMKMKDGKMADKKVMSSADADDMEKSDDMEGDDMMGKALTVTLADGSQVEAMDASAALLALQEENGEFRAKFEDMQKAFGHIADVVKGLISKQANHGDMLKALQTTTDSVAGAGAGRRTMVSIVEKIVAPAAAAAMPAAPTVTAGQVMMKAQQMCRTGALDWSVLPFIESHQGRGALAPPDLLRRFPELLTPIA